ncbi:MAG: hypothetical protein ABI602_04430 [Candidatus Saccharibacteria bacterium]
MNNKNLHTHSLPVIGILLSLFVLSLSLTSYAAPAGPTYLLSRALVARFVMRGPSTHGFARIQMAHQLSGARTQFGADPAAEQFQAVGRSSGQVTRLNLVVEALHPRLLSK